MEELNYPIDGQKCNCGGIIKINKKYKSKINPYEMEFKCNKCKEIWWYD